ncbi:hypothetical protein GRI97_13125 [Altererythrobacter xixiisoli]|uniref:Uncharacterized protein n=1 Tax=Croceibacterium xixiisoli TaxID=1476466 RepID=A0A6I4TXP8_9SPHN|nr:hypothetical protein [Croceibacterium xixiisoli]MXO99929.1 hypothetical protein [Croceibacterium xixiisoli]
MASTKATRRSSRKEARPSLPVSPYVLALRAELATGSMRKLGSFALRDLAVDVAVGQDAVWALVRRAGKGGLALRVAQLPGGATAVRKLPRQEGEVFRLEATCVIGRLDVALRITADEIPVLRATTVLTPSADLLIPFYPRDLYPLDAHDDPTGAEGKVEAAQRGLNSGVCYLRLEQPAFGSVLYLQNFTSLNDRFQVTETTPDGAVGGEWPELGYLPTTPRQSPEPPLSPQSAGQPVTVYDALIAIHDDCDADETAVAHRYLTLLGSLYRQLGHPQPEFHDWTKRAEQTLRDLETAPEASLQHYGFRYLHPYTAAEYPDSMVQLSVIAALRDYEAWRGEEIPLKAELSRGLRKFYDRELQTLRRYLPNVGKDKDKDAVDSWYLYHPLLNLGRLALDGDRRARRLFGDAIDFTIRAAHHFAYRWPIQYNVTDFSVITATRGDQQLGQTDVGGIYAHVMLQAFELTDDKRFLEEARAAIAAARGMRFELNYQANLTAWGAAACMRLWRIDNDPVYLEQSYVYLASFFHNVAMWESAIGHARHYTNFLGVTALHDAPYMALYECFESFAAFERYLKDGGPDLDPHVRLLVSEYCRYAPDRAWFYYPDTLPADAVAKEQRENNGHVDRALSFPVEDLYVDGQPAGQVGQEIYGCGAAFVFTSRLFHHFDGVPFVLFCDHFLLALDRPSDRTLSFQLGGGDGRTAVVRLIRQPRKPLPKITVHSLSGNQLRLQASADVISCDVPANGRIIITW